MIFDMNTFVIFCPFVIYYTYCFFRVIAWIDWLLYWDVIKDALECSFSKRFKPVPSNKNPSLILSDTHIHKNVRHCL